LATDRIAKGQFRVPVLKPASDSEADTLPAHEVEATGEQNISTETTLASVRERILVTAVETVLTRSPHRPVAVVVGGSFGRKEETILLRDRYAGILGDAEFFLICSTAKETQQVRGILEGLVVEIESQLTRRGIDCHVTCCAMSAEILRKMSPHILAFELRARGKVLWGDPHVLKLIPAFDAASIPKWDAWRSVSNRMIEQFNYVDALWTGNRSRVIELVYWTLKIQLELATLILLFEGVYHPTYRERADELGRIQVNLKRARWAAHLAKHVESCTQFKLDPQSSSPYATFFSGAWSPAQELAFAREQFLTALGLVRGVWLWGAERLIGHQLEEGVQPLEVGLELARRQDSLWRARGWARLGLADHDWLTPQGWGRFLRLSLLGSPRFLLYAVSAALYFAAEDWLTGSVTSANQVSALALRYFPFPRQRTAASDWPQASKIVVAAWDRFLRQSWA
jgi:hypothetical protein